MTSLRRAIGRGERKAASVIWSALKKELGFGPAIAVFWDILKQKGKGEPFARLGPAADERDRLSRRQCGDLVLLDRALRRRGHDELALTVARKAVLEGGVPFLDALLPNFEADPTEAEVQRLAASFFNAEGEARQDGAGRFAFDVHRCRFVELLTAVDATHLMRFFCEADDVFFDGKRRPILLRRSGTLARGASSCDFRFSRIDSGDEPSASS